MANKLKITLKKSIIGAKPQHRNTIQALGLKKLQQMVEKPDNPQIRGMVEQVKHMVVVEEI